ncbi:hypothetical protein KGF56_004805 [Candida oxycetoniae]|uniref:Uncharacterized protein n=1 Tax=Candida oxycetoniae TaxID=497107 RepID=A0AAI9STK9_9ASCO|nr:uncharacterized protein KGF56_004805 [Candida oxycetoniae]KAI3402397.2 hypothetical protein KGF56_004805 [Candida oxycetoniae]
MPTAGKDIAGEDIAGEDIAGEDIAGEDIAGEDIAGEDIAGEDIAGEDIVGIAGKDIKGKDIEDTECEWSFSYYEREYLGTSQTEQDDFSVLEPEPSSNEPVRVKPQEIKLSLNNPFILCKLNYFKRKASKNNLHLYNKKLVVLKERILSNVNKSKVNNQDSLLWKTTLAWILRKGNPSDILLNEIATRQTFMEIATELTLTKLVSDSWYTVGVQK